MPGSFSCPGVGISLTNDADQDIIEAVGGSANVYELIGIELWSTYTTDERLSLRLVRRTTTGSGGSAATEVKTEPGSAAPTLAVSHLVTTPGTLGDVIEAYQWSLLIPYIYLPIPESRLWIPPSGRFGLNLQTAVAATRTISYTLKWREYG